MTKMRRAIDCRLPGTTVSRKSTCMTSSVSLVVSVTRARGKPNFRYRATTRERASRKQLGHFPARCERHGGLQARLRTEGASIRSWAMSRRGVATMRKMTPFSWGRAST